MSQNAENNQNSVPPKKTPDLRNEKRGALAAVLMSGVIIAVFVVYYIVLGEESRKKNSLQLIIAVSKTFKAMIKINTYFFTRSQNIFVDG